jgi:hypothetical protein
MRSRWGFAGSSAIFVQELGVARMPLHHLQALQGRQPQHVPHQGQIDAVLVLLAVVVGTRRLGAWSLGVGRRLPPSRRPGRCRGGHGVMFLYHSGSVSRPRIKGGGSTAINPTRPLPARPAGEAVLWLRQAPPCIPTHSTAWALCVPPISSVTAGPDGLPTARFRLTSWRRFPCTDLTVRRHKIEGYVVELVCRGTVIEAEFMALPFTRRAWRSIGAPEDGQFLSDRPYDLLKELLVGDAAEPGADRRSS